MPFKANYKLGALVIQIEGDNIKELFEQTELLSQCPTNCGECGSGDITPGYQKVQGKFEYYFLKCRGCKSEFKFGMRQSDKGLFPKTNEGKNGWLPEFSGSRNSEAGSGSNDEEGWS